MENGANKISDNCCAARQSARSVLMEQASHMRRKALQLIQQADHIEQLANVMAGISGPPGDPRAASVLTTFTTRENLTC